MGELALKYPLNTPGMNRKLVVQFLPQVVKLGECIPSEYRRLIPRRYKGS